MGKFPARRRQPRNGANFNSLRLRFVALTSDRMFANISTDLVPLLDPCTSAMMGAAVLHPYETLARCGAGYRLRVKRTTSLFMDPRESAILLPSPDNAIPKIRPETKCVSCCGDLPVSGYFQTLGEPERAST